MINAADFLVTVGADISDLLGKMGQATTSMGGFSNIVSRAIENSTRLFIINTIMGAVESVVSFATDAFIGLNATLEQSRVAFTRFQGSVDVARATLQELMVFAANTPFQFESVVKTTRSFMAMGLTLPQIRPMLLAIADGVAAFGKGDEAINRVTLAMVQMGQKGRVTAQDMNQISEAGIANPWKVLSAYMNKTVAEVRDLSEKGKISAVTFFQAFESFAQSNWAGMAAEQMKTFTGAMTTVQDNLKIAIATAFEPFFNYLRDGVVAIAQFTQSQQFATWSGDIAAYSMFAVQALEILATSFSVVFQAILSIVTTIGMAIYEALSWINPFATHSPSLVSQVQDGASIIAAEYAAMGDKIPNALQGAISAINAFKEVAGPGLAKAHDMANAKTATMIAYLGGPAVQAYLAAKNAADQLSSALAEQKKFIDAAERSLKAAENALKPLQNALNAARKHAQDVSDALNVAKSSLDAFMQAPLKGERAFQDAMFNNEKAAKQLQLTLVNMRLGSGLDDARARVDGLRGALQAAQDRMREFTSASLVGTQAYSDAIFNLELNIKQLQLRQSELKPEIMAKSAQIAKDFDDRIQAAKNSVSGLTEEMNRIKSGPLEAANQAVSSLKDQIQLAREELNGFVNAQLKGSSAYSDALFGNQQQVAKLKLALNEMEAAQNNSAGTSQMDSLKKQLDDIGLAQKKAKAEITDLTNAGAKKDNPSIVALNKQLDSLDLRSQNVNIAIDELSRAGGNGNAAMDALKKQISDLNREGENIRLREQLDLEPQRRALKKLTDESKELTFDQAANGIKDAKAHMVDLNAKLKSAEKDQDAYNARIRELNATIKDVNRDINGMELAKKLAVDTVEAPLKAIEAQINNLVSQQEKIRLREFLDLEPQRRAIQKLVDNTKELTFDKIRNGIIKSRSEVEVLTARLKAAEDVVKAKEKAIKAVEDALKRVNLEGEKIALARWLDTADTVHKLDQIVNSQKEIGSEEKIAAVTKWKDEVTKLTAQQDEANKAVQRAQAELETARDKVDQQRDAVQALKDAYSESNSKLQDMNAELQNAASSARDLQAAAEKAASAAKNGAKGGVGKGGLVDPDWTKLKGVGDIPKPDTTAFDEFKRKTDEMKGSLDALRASVQAFNDHIKNMKDMTIGAINAISDGIKTPLQAIGNGILNAMGNDAYGTVQRMSEGLIALKDGAIDVLEKSWQGFTLGFSLRAQDMYGSTQLIGTGFSNLLTIAVDGFIRPVIDAFSEMFDFMQNQGGFEELRRSFFVLSVGVGNVVAMISGPLLAVLTRLVVFFSAEWKAALQIAVGLFEIAITGITAIFTLLGDVMSGNWSKLGTDFVHFSDRMGRGVYTLVYGVLDLFKAFADFAGPIFTGLWDMLKEATSAFVAGLLGIWGQWWIDQNNQLAAITTGFLNWVQGISDGLSLQFTVMGNNLRIAWTLITTDMKNSWDGITTGIMKWLRDDIVRPVQTTWDEFWKNVGKTVETFKTDVKRTWDGITEEVNKWVAAIVLKVTTDWNKMWTDVNNAVTQFKTDVMTGISLISGAIAKAISDDPDSIKNRIINGFKDAVDGAMKSLTGDGSLYSRAQTAIGALITMFTNLIGGDADSLKAKIVSGFNIAINAVVDGPLAGIYEKWTGPFKRAFEAIKNFVRNMWNLWNNRPQQGSTPEAPPESQAPTPSGANASGGRVYAGQPTVVGERGPEMFVPRQNGTIIPNGASSANVAMGGDITIYVEMDGKIMAKTIAPHMVREIRVRTGMRL